MALKTVCAALAACALCVSAAVAGEVEDKIAELSANAAASAENGGKALADGRYSAAATEFEYAASYAKQIRAYGLAKHLAPAANGWSTENLEVVAVGAAMFGGGTSVQQDYVKGGETATLRILADSPLMQSFAMMLANPMLMAASSDGPESVMIDGRRAIVQPQGDGVQISMPVNNAYLIQAEGERDSVIALIEASNIQALLK